MRFMKRLRPVSRAVKVSNAMKAAARRLATEAGIHPLQPGQQRPDDFYLVSHFTGEPIIKDRNAVASRERKVG